MKNFTPRKMVGWFDVGQLAGTAVRSILSSIFGSRADKREMLAALASQETYDHSNDDKELWIDYMSDTGDGFNSTFSMMKLISEEELTVELNGEKKSLQRGDITVLGGDQVYPAPGGTEYLDRFIGPLEAASTQAAPEKTTDLYSIPGNHDWYDGLAEFVEIFCRQKKIGGYQTKQDRSYFAIQVTDNTWLWGIDIQLKASVDEYQFNYFESIADNKMKKGDNVILCTAEPAWVYNTLYNGSSKYEHLELFEQRCILNKGLVQKLSLTGDLHHYARYTQEEEGGPTKHKITSGGGGAFMHPTHNLPEKLTNMHDGDFDLKETFPKKKTSRKLALRNFLFPWNNIGFGLFLSVIYLVMAYTLYTTSVLDELPGNIFDTMASTSAFFDLNIVVRLFQTLLASPTGMLILLLFIFGFYSFCDKTSSRYRLAGLLGVLHGFSHVVLMIATLSFCAYFTHNVLNIIDDTGRVLAICLEVFIVGGLLSGVLVGVYLLISSLVFGMHDDEAFSSSKIEGYKNFLRIHIKGDKLTIYPIGIKDAPKWKKVNGMFRSKSKMKPELIDTPIVVDLSTKEA